MTDGKSAKPKLTTKCPICKKPSTQDYRPFCSKRCSDVDLGRWMTESYSVPGNPAIEED